MCENVLLLVIFNIINKVVLVAKIALPTIIMVMGAIDLIKTVADGTPDSIKKSLQSLVYRFIASVTIFFLPSIVFAIMNLSSSYDRNNNASCLLKVTSSDITTAQVKKADAAVTVVENDLSYSNYNIAKRYVNKVDDENSRASLQGRLDICKEALDSLRKQDLDNRLAKAKAYSEAAAAAKANTGSSSGGVDNVLNLPYYNQGEGAYNPISTSAGDYNTKGCGCGYVSLAMVRDGLTASSGGPEDIIKKLYPKVKSDSACAIPDYAFQNEQISQFGISSKLIFGRQNTQSASELSSRKQAIVSALESGNAVILLVPGHYITLAGIENGEITVLDPGDRYKNGKYTIDQINEKYVARSGQTGFVMAYGFKKK